jgi:replication-associated recombination protein RarA
MAEVREAPTLAVPAAIRDPRARDPGRRNPLDPAEAYLSPHAAADGVGTTTYLPQARTYYEPTQSGFEAEVAARLATRRAAAAEALQKDGAA